MEQEPYTNLNQEARLFPASPPGPMAINLRPWQPFKTNQTPKDLSSPSVPHSLAVSSSLS